MAPRPWATEEQLTFLNGKYEHFLDHQKRQTLSRFWSTLEHAWFAQFPERAALFGSSADALTAAQETALGEAIKARKSQLQRWFRNKAAQQGRRAQASRTVWDIVSSSLSAKKHRLPQPVEVYSRKYYNEKVKASVKAEIADRQLGKKETLDVIKRLTKETYENETDKIKAEIQQEIDTMKTVDSDEEPESDELPAVPTPTQRQTAIDNMPAMLNAFFTALERQTGWAFTVLGGGPSPNEGGAIRTMSFHQGLTVAGHNFGQATPEYKAHIAKPFLDFVKVLFSTEVRSSYALNLVTTLSPEPALEAGPTSSGDTTPSPSAAVPSHPSELETNTASDVHAGFANGVESRSRHNSPSVQSLTGTGLDPSKMLPSADCPDVASPAATAPSIDHSKSFSTTRISTSPSGNAVANTSPPILQSIAGIELPTIPQAHDSVALPSTIPVHFTAANGTEFSASLTSPVGMAHVGISGGFDQADAAIGLLDLLNGTYEQDLHLQTGVALNNVTNKQLSAELEPQVFDFSVFSDASFPAALQFPFPHGAPTFLPSNDPNGSMNLDVLPEFPPASHSVQEGTATSQAVRPVAMNIGLQSTQPPLSSSPSSIALPATQILSLSTSVTTPSLAPGLAVHIPTPPDSDVSPVGSGHGSAGTNEQLRTAYDGPASPAITASRGRSPSRSKVPTGLQQRRPALGLHHPATSGATSMYIARPTRERRAPRRADASPERPSTSISHKVQMLTEATRVMPISKAQQKAYVGKENVPPASAKKRAATQDGSKKSKRVRKN